ncbi:MULTISPECIES: MupG family TIM beta-alpha barrel fold protein [unclassified Breznakia]|uniref:MupG family TIM beta-alpha barrel fold protein n=1 Tax=unclassified Breznakia TaxID=2623764 RepID=UPI0024735076|nr:MULTISPECIES: MupG family TIM beta-alpha barrel fold protein [unclassified Breznakia]MDH6365927.1 hypothetical protein [Breznakia sp. PH1-1]MDH6403141.1 hypothetical protein [Breznakia sp. PF1-11]MDH6410850.1 hypothetical protein [Breznakia sp. PFB1-11]MDH6413093.1 hypothetical protein [Breznakia sp. PFB1-14]MDH6415461.1 hypothetical protein [Breznakia sp. PFB1-4]
MLKTIGFAYYVTTFREQKGQLQTLPLQGNMVFTSLHIAEEYDDAYVEDVKEMFRLLKKQDTKIIADISKRTLAKFDLPNVHSLIQLLGIDLVRLDYGFSDEETIAIANEVPLVVNASTIDVKLIEKLPKGHVYAMHNFYPRKDTGLDVKQLKDMHETLVKHEVKSIAFIPGEKYRGPIFEGLPTLEKHRDMNGYVAALEILWNYYAEYVFVGDIGMNSMDCQFLSDTLDDQVIRIPVVNVHELLKPFINQVFTNRIDSPSKLIRLQESREFASQGAIIEPVNTTSREYGSITIDNKNYLRYSGEIQITKKDFTADERVNVIGNVHPDYLSILECITHGTKLMFVEK